jgi:hypothetical protein
MFLASSLDLIKSWTPVASSLGSLLALCAAAFWFVRTAKAKQRIQFDLDCKIYALFGNPDEKVAEIQFIFENKGFVEHRIYDLTVSLHALESEQKLQTKSKTGELVFARRILGKTTLEPPGDEYYFIRPGVRQVITHIVPIDHCDSVIRVTAGFQYVERGAHPHTSRRVFPTATTRSEPKPYSAT